MLRRPSPTGPRAARALWAVATLLVAGAAWYLWTDAPAPSVEAPASPAAVAALPLPVAASAPGPAPSSVALALRRADDDAAGYEVCGAGRISAEQFRRWQANPDLGKAWLEQQTAALDGRTQAAVVDIAGRMAAGALRQQVAARLLMGDPEGAAALAAPGSDLGAYQLAMAGCAGRALSGGTGCGALSVPRWIALDNRDARPWLLALSQAQQAKDVLAAETALAMLAERPQWSRHSHLLSAEVLQALPPTLDPALRAHVLTYAIGVQAGWANVGLHALRRACGGETYRQPARQAVCRTVSQQMLAATDDFLEATVAQKLADNLGVPKRDQTLTAETLAAAWAVFVEQAQTHGGTDLRCRAVLAQGDVSAQLARQGELAYALGQLRARQQGR